MITQERALLVPTIVVLAISIALFGAYLNFLAHAGNTFNDFFVFWSAARELQQQPLAQLYDTAGFQAFMRSLELTSVPLIPHPFLYPPYTALLFAPFGLLPFYTGLLLWNGLSLTVYLIAVWQALRPRTALAFIALLAPATMVNLLFGQTGLLTSALTIFGFSLLHRRPATAGFALGLLAIKPQLALLPFLVLLTSRNWKASFAAAITISIMIAAGLFAFGADAWQAWFLSLGNFSGSLSTSATHQQNGVTVYFALLTLGAGTHIAMAVQTAIFAIVLWSITAAMRRSAGEPRTTMAALIGPLLATPYALIYDLPVLSAACLMFVHDGLSKDFRRGQLAVISIAWFLPLIVFVTRNHAGLAAPIVLALLFLLIQHGSATTTGTISKRAQEDI